MREILILSYHALPMNVIASYRPYGYLQHLSKFGIKPTLVTHNWKSNEEKKDAEDICHPKLSVEEGEQFNVYKIPITQPPKDQVASFSQFKVLLDWAKGNFDTSPQVVASEQCFEEFVIEHLIHNRERYALVLGIFTPFHHLRLCYRLNRKYDIPYVLDFRDLHDNRVVSNDSVPLKTRIRNFFASHYIKKWGSKALFVSSVSKPLTDYLSKLTGVPGYEVRNGYEGDLIGSVEEQLDQEYFNLTSMGTLKDHQDFSQLFAALKEIDVEFPSHRIKVNFVGVNESQRRGSAKQIRESVPASMLVLRPRIPKREAIASLKLSHILLFPNVIGTVGYFSGRIFEYLGVRRNILAFPDESQEIRSLLSETGTGVSMTQKDEIKKHIVSAYKAWEAGTYQFIGHEAEIEKYDRINQTAILASRIHQYIDKE